MAAPSIHRVEIAAPLPPHRLVEPLLASPSSELVCALDAATAEGWGSPPAGGGPGRSVLASEPDATFVGGLDALEHAEAWLRAAARGVAGAASLIGAIAYDLGRTMGGATTRYGGPLVHLGGFRAVYRFDPSRARGWVCGGDAPAVRRLVDRIEAATRSSHAAAPRERAPSPKWEGDWARTAIHDWGRDARHAWEAAERTDPLPGSGRRGPADGDLDCRGAQATAFREGVDRIRAWIRAGDVYQVNLTRRIALPDLDRDAAARLYAALVERSPAPFCALLSSPELSLVSNSPERFLRRSGGVVETCPIKGTRPRGATAEQDRRLAKELLSSPKDAAEHLMIVDLERNDLGRLAKIGTVRVNRLAELRSFANVHHLVSSVSAQIPRELGLRDLLGATFPGGSITGAPKLRAMEIIEALEPVPRGFYTGAIGEVDGAGDVDLSLAIRTAVTQQGRTSLHVGGGIVWDSDPAEELRETEDKAASFRRMLRTGP